MKPVKALVLSRKSDSDSQQFEGRLTFTDVPDPVSGPGEALIKVRMAGICRTDQELVKGYMNFEGIPGHEFVGEVVEVDKSAGDEAKELIGKRVVGEINCGCGSCSWCELELQNHCPDRTVLGISGRDGAFAEYLTLPLGNLYHVPDDVNDKTAVFTEPLAAALEIFEQVPVNPDDSVVIIGDGKLGLLIAKAFQISGYNTICVGGADGKLDILRSWGIQAVHYREYKPTLSDLVVEASGSPDGFAIALASLKPRGTLVLKSTYRGSLTFDAAPLVIDEITVIGSRCGPFQPALKLLRENRIPAHQLITEVYSFHQVEEAFQRAAEPDALKVLIACPR